MRYQIWLWRVKLIAKRHKLRWLLGDVDHRWAYLDGLSPREYVQELYEDVQR